MCYTPSPLLLSLSTPASTRNMSNGVHITAFWSGFALAVTTGGAFSAELVEVGAASSIRWNGVTPPPQIIVPCACTKRHEQFPILKAAKPKVDDDDLFSLIKKA
jgi:hypothetical protein